jgi:acyl-homoserine lactone acylase PvdQ
VISSILGVILLLALLAGGAFYVSLETVHSWPREAVVENLSAPVEIAWSESRIPEIRAQTLEDRLAALGYVHGLTRTWSVVLLRQTARGRLGEWVGAPADSVDRWARQLGWADRAREAYENLPDRRKKWFRAYARGINGGFEARSHRTPELLVLGLEPKPWEPWHALAVEQLIAWLGGTNLSERLAAAGDLQARGWAAGERMLHRWLRLHDFEHSGAWAVENSSDHSLMQRQVYGSAALPLFHEVRFDGGDEPRLIASIPGTLMLPAGVNGSYAWSVFPTSSVVVDSVSSPGTDVSVRRELMRRRDGSAHVTEVRHSREALFLSEQTRLQWTGFTAATDVEAWAALWRGTDPEGTFELFDGAGLIMRRDGTPAVLGEPAVVRRFAGGVVVGQDPWIDRFLPVLRRDRSAGASHRLNEENASGNIYYSPWADSLRTTMVAALGSSRVWASDLREAMAYVRNWDATFEGASIGASIFDTWLAVYADSTGRVPLLRGDRTGPERIVLYETFARSVDRLIQQFGENMSRWRWERVQPGEQYFPLWAVSDIFPLHIGGIGSHKYSPVRPGGGGHPSTLRWGASMLRSGPLSASAAWEASISTSNGQQMYVRKSDIPVDEFLGRYLEAHEHPRIFGLDSVETAVHRMRLQPASTDS